MCDSKALFRSYILEGAFLHTQEKAGIVVRSVLKLLSGIREEKNMETKQKFANQSIAPGDEYYDLERRSVIREGARKLRRQYLRYKEAEIIYSMSHKKLLELAGKAGAIVRIDATVLIDRDIFDEYLEQFREESTLFSGKRYAR